MSATRRARGLGRPDRCAHRAPRAKRGGAHAERTTRRPAATARAPTDRSRRPAGSTPALRSAKVGSGRPGLLSPRSARSRAEKRTRSPGAKSGHPATTASARSPSPANAAGDARWARRPARARRCAGPGSRWPSELRAARRRTPDRERARAIERAPARRSPPRRPPAAARACERPPRTRPLRPPEEPAAEQAPAAAQEPSQPHAGGHHRQRHARGRRRAEPGPRPRFQSRTKHTKERAAPPVFGAAPRPVAPHGCARPPRPPAPSTAASPRRRCLVAAAQPGCASMTASRLSAMMAAISAISSGVTVSGGNRYSVSPMGRSSAPRRTASR